MMELLRLLMLFAVTVYVGLCDMISAFSESVSMRACVTLERSHHLPALWLELFQLALLMLDCLVSSMLVADLVVTALTDLRQPF